MAVPALSRDDGAGTMTLVAPGRRQLVLAERPASQPVAYRDGVAISWNDFRARVAGLMAQLVERSEDSWAVCCQDAYDFACGFFAVLASNKRVVVPPNFQPGTLETLRDDAQGCLIDRLDGGCYAPARAIGVAQVAPGEYASSVAIATDAIVDVYTSGTTAAPKRIRKRVAQLSDEAQVLESLWGAELGAATIIGTVPHHHIYGLLFRLLWPLCAGRPFDVTMCSGPEELVPRLRAYRDAAIVSSPAQLGRLPDLMDVARLASARAIFSSGGPLAAKAARAYVGAIGRPPIEVYGSSETGGIGWRAQSGAVDGDTWMPMPGVDARIAADGSLQVRSPFADSDAWVATADAAEAVAGGRLRLLGRLDRVVKIEEKRASLPEMEERLRRHPWVSDAGLTAIEGARRVLGAVVVLTADGRAQLGNAGKQATSGELRRFLAQYYEPPLLPRRWRFPAAMPFNERGKVSSAALAALLGQAEQ
jgi:acyl-coenzyme A synthetase/AMP-(fatty) acid ligase